MKTSHLSRRDKGFSLSEVAMSLGIATVALLTLLSLMPIGLTSLRESGNLQAQSRIVQSVLSSYQVEDWSSHGVSSLADRTLFFDLAGTGLESPDKACSYVVRVEIGNASSVLGDGEINSYLREIRLRITDAVDDYESALKDNSSRYQEHSTWIALLEKTNLPATAP